MLATAPWYEHLQMDVPAASKVSFGAAPVVSLTVKVGILHCPEHQKVRISLSWNEKCTAHR